MLIKECIITKYGSSCIFNSNYNDLLLNIFLYFTIRNMEITLKKIIEKISKEDIDLYAISFS